MSTAAVWEPGSAACRGAHCLGPDSGRDGRRFVLISPLLACKYPRHKRKLDGRPHHRPGENPMARFRYQAPLLAMFLLLIGVSAQAATLSLPNCGSCDGSDVSLDITTSDGGATYDVILKLDSTNYTGNRDSIVQAGFKAFSGISDGDVKLVSVTSGTYTDPVLSALNAAGYCEGPGNPDFVCSKAIDPANIVGGNKGEYLFTFEVDGTNATLLSEWTIKFQYCDADTYDGGAGDCNGGLISEPGTPGEPGPPVPEPSAALVFGAGLLVAAPRLRRRR